MCCGSNPRSQPETSLGQKSIPPIPAGSGVRYYTYQVITTWPHDTSAYTQGLEFYDGRLFEGTGLNGQSSLREVDLGSGRVLRKIDLSSEYFGEGITVFGGQIFQLTWQNHKGFIYQVEDFKKIGGFSYVGEGWGLTHDAQNLIMSDGTNQIRFLDPKSFEVRQTISVLSDGTPVQNLNELEYIQGEILANVYESNYMVRIDPANGKVRGWIDLTGLLSPADRTRPVDVLNGIAYDAARDRLIVTGKLWPKIFQIRLVQKTL